MTAEEIYKKLVNPSTSTAMTKWTNHFYTLADPSMFNWKMEMDDDVGIALLAYRMECEEKAEKMPEHEDVKKSELAHRHFKALKLAGVYAFVDASADVEMDHLHAAIKLVEESGDAFQSDSQSREDLCEAGQIHRQVGTEVTHADLDEALPSTSRARQPATR